MGKTRAEKCRRQPPRRDWGAFLEQLRRTGCIKTSAELVGATEQAAHKRRRNHPVFASAVKVALSEYRAGSLVA